MKKLEKQRRDRYLKNKYGRSLNWYNRQLKKNKGGCHICGRLPVKLPLAVDHWHKLEKLKVKIRKLDTGLWQAYNIAFSEKGYVLKEGKCCFKSHNKKKAKKQVKLMLKRKANRGLLCWACNSGLRKWLDNAVNLRNAADYLERHQLGK
jgi:hypothetical protein